MDSGRLIVDPPASGAWNMAVDEALLESAERRRQSTLRFYQWDEPTLSLGYFQAYAARKSHADSTACPLVRRSTGGGAILHDFELTYSFVRPIDRKVASKTPELYQVFHKTLLEVLATRFGVTASMFVPKDSRQATDQPFLCFQRRTEGDVVINGCKIAGSAQRRRRGAVLQHGSILLRRSNNAPELLGINDIAHVALLPADLISPWSHAINHELNLSWSASQLDEQEIDLARATERHRFAARDWSRKR